MGCYLLAKKCEEQNQILQEMKKTHTQKDLASAAGLTEVTVRNRFQGLLEDAELAPVLAA